MYEYEDAEFQQKQCFSPLATRPVLYIDTVGGKQTCRDDLWAVTTEELNAVHKELQEARNVIASLKKGSAYENRG